jgi:hypothetical protein
MAFLKDCHTSTAISSDFQSDLYEGDLYSLIFDLLTIY